jgi:hypothetical protein
MLMRLPLFYGWVIVGVVFVTMGVGVNASTASRRGSSPAEGPREPRAKTSRPPLAGATGGPLGLRVDATDVSRAPGEGMHGGRRSPPDFRERELSAILPASL